MANAIRRLGHVTAGFVRLGMDKDATGTVGHQVHDGDTVVVRAPGNFGVRLLGVDAPEISFEHPDTGGFRGIDDPLWEPFLSNPFRPGYRLDAGLKAYLQARVGPGCAANHARHARAAELAFEREVRADLKAMGQTESQFEFFLLFVYEILDGYGRFLAYVNRNQPADNTPGPRPFSYNRRLLDSGRVSPYFIWPNISPYKKTTVPEAVPKPGKADLWAKSYTDLRDARAGVKQSRAARQGLYEKKDPLRLEAFELRFLARQEAPSRWVIDLNGGSDVILPPQQYHTIALPEDRLFVPLEYVPLFVEKGWKRG